MVLLKNDASILPLSPTTWRIALIGPLADNKADLLGCWTMFGRKDEVETILDAITSSIESPSSLVHVSGCAIVGDGPDNILPAIEAARSADIIIAVLGESADMSGEAHSRAHLGLPGRQQELLDALAATGKPIIGVLLTGRPLVIPRILYQVSALLVAWHSGVRTARALADILFGAVNPSGKLTANWPRSEGQIPIYYAHKNTGRPAQGEGTKQFDEPFKSRYIDELNEPLFPFGFGLATPLSLTATSSSKHPSWPATAPWSSPPPSKTPAAAQATKSPSFTCATSSPASLVRSKSKGLPTRHPRARRRTAAALRA